MPARTATRRKTTRKKATRRKTTRKPATRKKAARKTTRKKTTRKRAAALIGDRLPASVGSLTRQLRTDLNAVEKQIQTAGKDARRGLTRVMRDASHSSACSRRGARRAGARCPARRAARWSASSSGCSGPSRRGAEAMAGRSRG